MIYLLTGPKHSGKSSVGRALARLTGFPFCDLDDLVEARTGKSPRSLYREGPGVFRKAEAGAMAFLAAQAGDRIAAAGGGLADNEEALALVRAAPGIRVLCLEVSPETAWRRIQESGGLPPFLDTPNPEATHRALHLRRAGAYRRFADFTVDAEGKSPEEAASELFRFICAQS